MRKVKNLLMATIFIFFVIFSFNIVEAASNFDLKTLDFDASLKTNGDMHIVEIWTVKINGETNTLFKTFEKDYSKYKGIRDVQVSEIKSDGEEFQFTRIDNLMYHVTTDCYYGLDNDYGNYEIAWGINLSTGTKTYKVSYIVEEAVSRYQNMAEIYWQFIGNDFEAAADTVTGKITLPSDVKELDNLRVWGHGRIKWRNK